MKKMMAALAALMLVASHQVRAETINARAWQATSRYEYKWPEDELPELAGRASLGFGFSGGGSRAFVFSTGYGRALHELGLMSEAKYTSSVSGGSWFSIVYNFYQSNAQVCDDAGGLDAASALHFTLHLIRPLCMVSHATTRCIPLSASIPE